MSQKPLPVSSVSKGAENSFDAHSPFNGARLGIAMCLFLLGGLTQASAQSLEQPHPNQLREVYQDWTVSCQKSKGSTGAESSRCQMGQELRNKNTQ